MRTLLALTLSLGCAGSLVDQAAATVGDESDGTPTAACQQSCTTTVSGADPLCVGDTCTYACKQPGKLKCSLGCCDVTALSAGTSHTCAIAGGEARCWGSNDQGQLGRAVASSFVPVQAAGVPSSVTAIAAGSKHTCALAAGEVWCWGDNTFGQLGLGTSGATTGGPTPHRVPDLSGILLIAAGGSHSCAADASQTYCWGRGDSGQLGDGSTSAAPQPTPKAVPGFAGAIGLAAGDAHTCAFNTSGVFCWGANSAGQLGTGSATNPIASPPASAILDNVSFLGLGANHTCAGRSGSLMCWGANSAKQIDTSGRDQPSPKGVLSGATAVAGGIGHTCAITDKQTVRCWGLNDQGQLGGLIASGGSVDVNLPGVQKIAAGFEHTCAIQSGAAFCWGLNDRGQLGANPGAAASSAAPVAVSGR